MLQRKVIWYSFFIFTFLILYNTLIPFRFNHNIHDLPQLLGQMNWRPYSSPEGHISKTDIVGNILLFIPFGFLLYMILNERGSRLPLLIATVAGMTLSLGIEITQLFIANRNSAIHDVIHNTLGSGIGAVLARIYAFQLESFLRKHFYRLLNRKPFLLLLIIIGALQFVAALMPFTVSITVSDLKRSLKSLNLFPFQYQSVGKWLFHEPNQHDALPWNWAGFVENLLFWIVVGYLLYLCYRIYWQKKDYGRRLLWGIPLIYFPVLEFAQLFIVSRIPDINDIISGYLGITVGFLVYHLVRPWRRKMYKTHLDLLIIPLLLYGIFILFAGLQPFDWTFDPAVIHKDLTLSNLIPFYAYFRKTSLWNIYDLVNSLTYFLPFSLYWSYRLHQKGKPYSSIYWKTTLTALLLGLFIELTQVFSFARTAEITDAIAYGLGGTLGTFLIYYYEMEIKSTALAVKKGLLKLA